MKSTIKDQNLSARGSSLIHMNILVDSMTCLVDHLVIDHEISLSGFFFSFFFKSIMILLKRESCSVMSDSLQANGWQPVRLLCPWGFSRQEYWSG